MDTQTLNEGDGSPVCKPGSSAGELYDVWKPHLYTLQMNAPCPVAVVCKTIVPERPAYFGTIHHGKLSHSRASKLLRREGSYLVRQSENPMDYQTLSLKFNAKIKHFKLYYDGQYYVREKRFDAMFSLVADGLITMYLELHAGPYIEEMYHLPTYEKSPYMTLNKLKRKEIINLKNLTSDAQELPKLGEDPEIDYVKAHVFKVHTFKGLHWCDMCGNFMWGFIQQGVKCEDCGFTAHGKCSERVPSDCCPDLKNIRGAFGINLCAAVKASGGPRPFVVDKCISEIEKRGLDVEGIYRVSGFAEEIEALKLAFDKDGVAADLSPSACENINVIAGTLKLFLRLLPIPLISHEIHPILIEASKMRFKEDQKEAMKKAYLLLHAEHFHTLQYLMEHLVRVAAKSATNKMTARNLSTVFAPTLMPAPISIPWDGALPAMTDEIAVIEMLITNHHLIF